MGVAERASTDFGVMLGKRIQHLRKARGLKQKTLADMLGYKSHTAIVNIEAGEQMLSVETALAIARVLGVSLLELVGAQMLEDGPTEEHEPWVATLREKALAWPEDVRQSLAEMFEAFAHELKAFSSQPVKPF